MEMVKFFFGDPEAECYGCVRLKMSEQEQQYLEAESVYLLGIVCSRYWRDE